MFPPPHEHGWARRQEDVLSANRTLLLPLTLWLKAADSCSFSTAYFPLKCPPDREYICVDVCCSDASSQIEVKVKNINFMVEIKAIQSVRAARERTD